MRTIYWILGGIGIAGLTILTVWLNTASAGDRILVRERTMNVSGTNKTSLINAIKVDYPSLVAAGVSKVEGKIKVDKDNKGNDLPGYWTYKLSGDYTQSEADYSVAHGLGNCGFYSAWVGGQVTASCTITTIVISDSGKTAFNGWLSGLFGISSLDKITDFIVARNPGNATVIDATVHEIYTLSAHDWMVAGGGKEGEPTTYGVVQ
jgi:hypothetical protein